MNKVMKANEALESYPIQFKDKLDEYLWKEHHILGGCCSSIESTKYAVAREVAERLTDAFVEKATEWLKENADMYEAFEPESKSYYMDKDKLVENFKEYMKGE